MEQQQKARMAIELRPGTVVAGRFVIEDLLAEGSMGRVYRARQEPMGREVALKVMRRFDDRSPEAVRRFFQEAVAVSKLKHPNSITLFDFGRDDNELLYLAMELVEGKSLREVLVEHGRLGLRRTVRIISQVALSLAEAHRLGIVHRDLKPANILLVDLDGQPDFVKVIDFGMALLERPSGERLTRKGVSCGTPAYMSPEQLFEGHSVDRRSDLFALGVLLYEMLEGRRPFDGQTVLETIERRRTGPPDPMTQRCPASVRDFVCRLLARDPAQRPESAEAMLEELQAALPPGLSLHVIEPRRGERRRDTVRVDVVPTLARSEDEDTDIEIQTLTPGLETLLHLEVLSRGAEPDPMTALLAPALEEPGGDPVAEDPSESAFVLPIGRLSDRHQPWVRAPWRARLGRRAWSAVGAASLALAAVALVLWGSLGTPSRTETTEPAPPPPVAQAAEVVDPSSPVAQAPERAEPLAEPLPEPTAESPASSRLVALRPADELAPSDFFPRDLVAMDLEGSSEAASHDAALTRPVHLLRVRALPACLRWSSCDKPNYRVRRSAPAEASETRSDEPD
jgi:serine/threonine protein kinase